MPGLPSPGALSFICVGYKDRSINSPSIVAALGYRAGVCSGRVQFHLFLLPILWSRTHALVSTWPLPSPTRSWCEPQPWNGSRLHPPTNRRLPAHAEPWSCSSSPGPQGLPAHYPIPFNTLLGSRGVERVEKTMPDASGHMTASTKPEIARRSGVISYACVMPSKAKKDSTYPSSLAFGPFEGAASAGGALYDGFSSCWSY